MRTTKLVIIALAVLAALAAFSPHASAQQDCAPVGEVEFVCGPENAEDLVLVPDTRWILASGMTDDASFYLVDSRAGDWRPLGFEARRDASHGSRLQVVARRRRLHADGRYRAARQQWYRGVG